MLKKNMYSTNKQTNKQMSINFEINPIGGKPINPASSYIQPFGGSQIYDLADLSGAYTNVKIYGAQGDGYTDDTFAIQTALDNNNYIYFPAGTYRITYPLTITRGNMKLKGDSAILSKEDTLTEAVLMIYGGSYQYTTTSISTISETSFNITVADASNIQAGDWIYLTSEEDWYQVQTSSFVTKYNTAEVAGVAGNVVTVTSPWQIAMNGGTNVITLYGYRPIQNISLSGLKFQSSSTVPDIALGTGPMGIYVNNVSNLVVTNCSFYYFWNSSIYSTFMFKSTIVDSFFQGTPSELNMTLLLANSTGYDGFVTNIANVITTIGCTGYKVRYLTSSKNTSFHTINSCTSNEHHGAMMHFGVGSIRCTVINNTGTSAFGAGVFNEGGTPVTLVSANSFNMTSNDTRAIYEEQPIDMNQFTSSSYTSMTFNSSIKGNVFQVSNGDGLYLGQYYSSLDIVNNTIQNCKNGITIGSVLLQACSILKNTILCSNPASGIGILFLTNANVATRDNIIINENIIENFKDAAITLSSSTIPTYPMNTLSLKSNILDGEVSLILSNLGNSSYYPIQMGDGYYGSNIFISDNLMTNIPADQQQVNLGSSFRYERYPYIKYILCGINKNTTLPTIVSYSSTGTLTGFNLETNNILLRSTPGASQGWICTQSGTFGTLNSVTGTANGTTTVTLVGNNSSRVTVGTFITLNATTAQVLSVSSNFATITTSVAIPAGTASVAFSAPTMNLWGVNSARLTSGSSIITPPVSGQIADVFVNHGLSTVPTFCDSIVDKSGFAPDNISFTTNVLSRTTTQIRFRVVRTDSTSPWTSAYTLLWSAYP